MERVRRRSRDAKLYRVRGVDVRCPSCGAAYPPAALRLHVGNTLGLAVCQWCYLFDGPDGALGKTR